MDDKETQKINILLIINHIITFSTSLFITTTLLKKKIKISSNERVDFRDIFPNYYRDIRIILT